jgi:pyruvate dehydrogenase E1 component
MASEVWSVTSFAELAREAAEVARWNRLHPNAEPRGSHVERCLPGSVPVVATTDYVRAYPQLVASYVEAPFVALGTDGFGRSDTRTALRAYFEVDRRHVVVAALDALAKQGTIERRIVAEAIARYGIEVDERTPWAR